MADSSYVYLINPAFQFMNVSGKPLTDGYINLYISGTRSKYYAFSDFEGTLHPFNIPLNSLGSAVVLVSPAHSYDVYVYNSLGTLQMSRFNIIPSTGEGTIITDVTTLTSDDNTVDIKANSSTEYDLSIANQISSLKNYTDQAKSDAISTSNTYTDTAISKKKDKQNELNFNGSATKTVKSITQNANGELNVEFEDIDLPQEVPNVEITSVDNSVNITSSVDAESNTKTFDLSVNVDDPLEYGQFSATNITGQAQLTKIKGNIDLTNNLIKLKKGNSYHFTIRGSYVADSAVNTATTISYIEYSSSTNIHVNVDNTITDPQYFEITYDVYNYSQNGNYNVSFSSIVGGKVSEIWVEVHSLNGVSVNGGSGGTTYTEGDAIDLTNDTISVKYSKGLGIDDNGNLEVKVGDGLTYNSVNNVIEVNKDEINNYVDSSLFIINTDGITDWIDITNEWQFTNGFNLTPVSIQPYNSMTIKYSPKYNLVKFFGECRITLQYSWNNSDWVVFLRYVGDRFYTSHNMTNLNGAPIIYPISPFVKLLPGLNKYGTSNTVLLRVGYVGNPSSQIEDTGMAAKQTIGISSNYGLSISNLVLKVYPKNNG